jgi:aspartate ammonia-lyase
MRVEKDFLGEVSLPDDALYGIQAYRAKMNFPDTTLFFKEWYQAIGVVKLACYQTYRSFSDALAKSDGHRLNFKLIPDSILHALEHAATEVSEGKHFDNFIVPAVSGGAGTSINMNVNEIIANVALLKCGFLPSDYGIIDPIEHANVYQSTNDVIPTALKVTLLKLLVQLEESINTLRGAVEKQEDKSRNLMRVGATQMQEAVPTSYGKLFSGYSDALSRDWWRVSKCFERIKVVKLGGSAIGTGLGVPRFFIMEVTPRLQTLTGLPITRSENFSDTTANLDSFVEVHAILKSHAVNLEKIVNDLRLLASDLLAPNDISIPQKQIGSTIMPAKVNPVIPEYVISVAHKVYANDQIVTSLAGQGCLDLNAYLPLIGHSMIESLKLLISANKTLCDNLVAGIQFHGKVSETKLWQSPAVTTALGPYIGYHQAAELARCMKDQKMDVFGANALLNLVEDQKLRIILKPENLLKLGYSIKDIQE